MKVQNLSIRYNVKRSFEYQTAEVGAELSVSVEEGDKLCDLFHGAVKKLSPLVEAEADAAIRDLCAASRQLEAL